MINKCKAKRFCVKKVFPCGAVCYECESKRIRRNYYDNKKAFMVEDTITYKY